MGSECLLFVWCFLSSSPEMFDSICGRSNLGPVEKGGSMCVCVVHQFEPDAAV